MDLGFLQKEVATFMGVSLCTITNWELGHTTPNVCYLDRITRFLAERCAHMDRPTTVSVVAEDCL